MRKLLFLLVFCSGLLMVNCEQDVVEEPKPILVKPVIEISISPAETIPYNSSAIIRYKNSSTTKCTVNGQVVDCSSGEFNTGILTATKTFTFVSTGEGGSTTKDVIINVEQALAPSLIVNKTEFKDKLNFGEKTNFSWKAEGLITSITLNDNPVLKDGYYFTTPLFENVEYILKVVGPGGEKVEKFSIIVGDWTTSILGILQHYKSWVLVKNRKLNLNREYMYDVVFPIKEEIVVTKESKFTFYWDGESVSSGDLGLRDDNKTLILHDNPVEITKINTEVFIYIEKIVNADAYMESEYVPVK